MINDNVLRDIFYYSMCLYALFVLVFVILMVKSKNKDDFKERLMLSTYLIGGLMSLIFFYLLFFLD